MAVPSRRVISAERVVQGGCLFFLRNATVDMDALAGALTVSRATLYRVVHSRDRLLGDVLWRLAERLLTQARAETTTTGVDGVLETTRRFAVAVRQARPFRAFLRAEPATAARVLFTPAGGVHARVVDAQRGILVAAAADPAWSPADLDGAAFLYVRIVESMLYAELIHGRRADPATAERAARAVLEAC
ncbi:QsdR family transcriptional regulator [Micromonospora sp. RHAY321]|uniref:QsdR family transcriptional regulator n=1 Tax=Micromonospora sp. RHAY321 TaxID=2944807 RepID=UPI00207CFD4F|nr:QsdR family transcriptional regulator [Micromonospora sp. RHAY321]MCO1597489.1 QsdR family transcriptional regulator [Micromonospora sp. RHAY321]